MPEGFVSALIQFGLPAVALGFSGWLGLKGTRATAKAQTEGQLAAEKIKAQTATEERLASLLEAQRVQFIVPLQEQVNRQGGEIEGLKTSLKVEQDEKWDAIAYIRALLTWASIHLSNSIDPLPKAPASIRRHVGHWHYPASPPTAPSAHSPTEPPTEE